MKKIVLMFLLLTGLVSAQNWSPAFANPSGCTSVIWVEVRQVSGGGGVAGEFYVVCQGFGVFKTVDNGATWINIGAGINWSYGPFTIQVNPHNDSLILATQSTSAVSKVLWYYSTNDGSAWNQVLPACSPNASMCYHNTSVGAHSGCALPIGGSTRLVCGGLFGSIGTAAWYSDNDGVTSTTVATGTSSSSYALGTNPQTGTKWLGGELAGVWESPDGVNWTQQLGNCPSPCSGSWGDVSRFAWDASGNTLITTNGGIWKSSGAIGSMTWAKVLNTDQGMALFKDSAGILYYGHRGGTQFPHSIYRSVSQGNSGSWLPWDTGMPNGLVTNTIVEYQGKLYSSSGGTVYSTPISGGTPPNPPTGLSGVAN